MNVDEIIQEAESIIAESKRVKCEQQAIERLERRESLVGAGLFLLLFLLSLSSVFGAVVLAFKLIFR